MGAQLFRIEPQGRPQDYQTYAIRRPLATHWRKATCEEVACPNWRNGWRTTLDLSTHQGQSNAAWIRARSGLRFTVERQGPMDVFTFPAGQRCFEASTHRISLEREPIFVVRGGDHRGNPTGMRRLVRDAVAWRDDMGEHLNNLRDMQARG